MKAISLAVATLTVMASPAPASAQTTGAFNMGQLTGTLSQDAVTQSEERRARRHRGARRAAPAGNRADDCAFLRKRVHRMTDEQYSLYRRGCLR